MDKQVAFWTNGRIAITRHCDCIYTLDVNDDLVMKGTWEQCAKYAFMEFNVNGNISDA